MGLLSGLAEIQGAVAHYGVLVVGLSILASELGIPMPLPNELVLAWAGYLARQGEVNVWRVLLVAVAADQAGSLLFYALLRTGGRALVERYGSWVFLTRARLGRAEAGMARIGAVAYFVGRSVPFLRIYTSGAAGLLRLAYRIVLPVGLLASLVWTATFLGLGMAVGEPTKEWVSGWHLHTGVVTAIVLAGIGLSLALAHLRRNRVRHHGHQDWQ
jgi:membrane protein DedA with SNARE-associated domain